MYDRPMLQSLKSVEVVGALGEWFVFISDGNGEPVVQPFDFESYARAYAEGQRIRLGLQRFTTV